MIKQVNNDTDVLFIQKEKGLVSTYAHAIFKATYQRRTAERLSMKTKERNIGIYYSLNKIIDKDLVDTIIEELVEKVPEVRFVWKENDTLIFLNLENDDDNEKIRTRVWKRLVAHRVTWVKQQEKIKKSDLVIQLSAENEFINLEEQKTTKTKRKPGRPSKNLNQTNQIKDLKV